MKRRARVDRGPDAPPLTPRFGHRPHRLGRLDTVLRWLVLCAVIVISVGVVMPRARALSGSNPVVSENALAGSSGWQIPTPGNVVADDIHGQIKGYASATSVNK